jgi:hypothetical protein
MRFDHSHRSVRHDGPQARRDVRHRQDRGSAGDCILPMGSLLNRRNYFSRMTRPLGL